MKEGSFESIPTSSWRDLVDGYQRLLASGGQWVFRGHRRSEWPLQTTLERAIYDFWVDTNEVIGTTDAERKEAREKLQKNSLSKKLGNGETVSRIEGGLLRRFQRQCHHYLANVPDEENILEWLALMQHYKAPTRLLDWTFSFFVSVYFAVEYADSACAVWALDRTLLTDRLKSKYPREWKLVGTGGAQTNVRSQKSFKFVFQKKKPLVIPVNPFKLNERSVIQQGIFLCPGDITKPFEDNLTELVSWKFEKKLFKFEIADDSTLRKDILSGLHRMNMNRATLFPGLDGFGESLRTLMTIPDILAPHPTWPK